MPQAKAGMLLIIKEIRAESGNVVEKKGGRWWVAGGTWGRTGCRCQIRIQESGARSQKIGSKQKAGKARIDDGAWQTSPDTTFGSVVLSPSA
jgi:hypothetical protein